MIDKASRPRDTLRVVSDGMSENPLGKVVAYTDRYSAELLFPIPRSQGRIGLGIKDPLPFEGIDRWMCYELSWLNSDGIPQVGIGTISYSARSSHIIESKSLKIYLGSLNFMSFESVAALESLIQRDLGRALGDTAIVSVTILLPDQWGSQRIVSPSEECIDSLTVERTASARLIAEDVVVEEQLYSNLLRSLCPVTSQPDWGTVRILYKGKKISRTSLLGYLIAHRSHQGYHEECCERIFSAIKSCCNPEKLWVGCFYTRRGGIDINPERWLPDTFRPTLRGRLARQ